MKNKKKKYLILLSVIVSSLLIVASTQPGDWKAPPEADKLINPIKGDAKATASGKKLYNQMCAICHGNKGKGDGMAGINLNPRPGDLSGEKFQSQTDGAVFWKISEGRSPMASYKTALTETQRWHLINYLRTLKK